MTNVVFASSSVNELLVIFVSVSNSSKSKTSINHSRGSSLTEEGYVPMAPGNSDDGYVDMDHGSSRHRGYFLNIFQLGFQYLSPISSNNRLAVNGISVTL